jgi:hypothetical protein
MRRQISTAALLVSAFLFLAAMPVFAQQSLTLNFGYFAVKGEDSRTSGDVLVENRTYLLFNPNDFSGATGGGEYLVALGDFLEVGAGANYYARTVHSVYDRWVNDDGSEIAQDLRLRVVPISATIRILPLGRRSAFQPYVGGGVGVFLWRYAETGDFVDFSDGSVFRNRYMATGTAVGPVAVFGARVATSSRYGMGMELRYQKAEGTLDSTQFYGDRIDLGGLNFLATFQVKF